MSRHRAPDEPHIEIHRESDGWHASAFDWDPIHGIVVISTVVVTFAAALTWVARVRRVVG